MMELVLPRSWKEEFALAAAIKREDILHREKLARFDAKQRQITLEQKTEQKRREQEFAAMEAALATPARVAQFHARLDSYDAKTVEFLMENGKELEGIRERIKRTLDQAQQLPDGTRVFKTEDGKRVFDEHGTQLDEDVIAPEMIPDHKIRWEVLKADRNAERTRAEQQEQALSFQEKLDDARLRSSKGEITKGELDRIEHDLKKDAPDALREKLGIEKPKANAAPNAPSPIDGMDALMQQTGLGPSQTSGPTRADRQPAPF